MELIITSLMTKLDVNLKMIEKKKGYDIPS